MKAVREVSTINDSPVRIKGLFTDPISVQSDLFSHSGKLFAAKSAGALSGASMARLKVEWHQIRENFDPDEVLLGHRAVDLYVERGASARDELNRAFGYPVHAPQKRLITGQRGTGLSSFLVSFAERVKNRYFVVSIDAGLELAIEKAEISDLLFLIGATVHNTAKNLDLPVDAENLTRLVDSFSKLVSPGPPNPRIEEEILENIDLIVADVETLSRKPVLVILDGLNRISNPDQIENIFVRSHSLFKSILSAVYTAPLSIFTFEASLLPSEIVFLENFPPGGWTETTTNLGTPNHPFEEVIRRRLEGLGIEAGQVVAPKALTKVIDKSGGNIKLFLRLLRDAFKHAELSNADLITTEIVEKVIDDFIGKIFFRLNTETLQELSTLDDLSPRPLSQISPQLINSQLVLAHKGREPRIYTHPILSGSLLANATLSMYGAV